MKGKYALSIGTLFSRIVSAVHWFERNCLCLLIHSSCTLSTLCFSFFPNVNNTTHFTSTVQNTERNVFSVLASSTFLKILWKVFRTCLVKNEIGCDSEPRIPESQTVTLNLILKIFVFRFCSNIFFQCLGVFFQLTVLVNEQTKHWISQDDPNSFHLTYPYRRKISFQIQFVVKCTSSQTKIYLFIFWHFFPFQCVNMRKLVDISARIDDYIKYSIIIITLYQWKLAVMYCVFQSVNIPPFFKSVNILQHCYDCLTECVVRDSCFRSYWSWSSCYEIVLVIQNQSQEGPVE